LVEGGGVDQRNAELLTGKTIIPKKVVSLHHQNIQKNVERRKSIILVILSLTLLFSHGNSLVNFKW
jgi:hypothetical protein